MPTPIKLKQGTNYYQPLCYFPIGYIYLSTSNANPGQFFGGTWEPIKDRFLLLAGNTYKAGQTGGEAVHKLTINEMPTHTHQLGLKHPGGIPDTIPAGLNYTYDGINNIGAYFGTIDTPTAYNNVTGGGQAHNNMPPYIVVYGWVKVGN